MALIPIRIYPDPVLRVDCPPVTEFDDDLRQLVDDMVQTMHAAPGVGLAAPQVGIEKQLAVVDVTVGEDPSALKVLINPRIVEEDGRELDSEGCLSIPDLTEKVVRPTKIKVLSHSLDGSEVEMEVEDFEARAFCHEIDHLHGVLFIDHLRGLRKEKARRSLKKLGFT
ncbi:MAG: peptide deformylase [Acidobacteriota bacterium]